MPPEAGAPWAAHHAGALDQRYSSTKIRGARPMWLPPPPEWKQRNYIRDIPPSGDPHADTSDEALFGGFGLPVDLERACLDERDQVAADCDRVVRILKTAQQERVNAEPVIFQYRRRDLLRRADQA